MNCEITIHFQAQIFIFKSEIFIYMREGDNLIRGYQDSWGVSEVVGLKWHSVLVGLSGGRELKSTQSSIYCFSTICLYTTLRHLNVTIIFDIIFNSNNWLPELIMVG